MPPKICYRSGYKYAFLGMYDEDGNYHRDYHCDIGIWCDDVESEYIDIKDGWITIRYGYMNDGPSGPTIDTKSSMRGALEHDAGYQLMREGKLSRSYQEFFDRRLEQCMIEDGAWKVRASLWERGLSIFGRRNTDPANRKPVLVAP